MDPLQRLWGDSGLAQLTPGQAVMMAICLGLLYLAIHKRFEPLLLVPIGFGGLLANIPGAGLAMSAVDTALASGDVLVMADDPDDLRPVPEGGPVVIQRADGN